MQEEEVHGEISQDDAEDRQLDGKNSEGAYIHNLSPLSYLQGILFATLFNDQGARRLAAPIYDLRF